MALRIEHVLLVSTVLVTFAALTLVYEEDKTQKKQETKELVFTKTTFTEVDTQIQKSTAYCTSGIRDNAVLEVENLIYKAVNIDSLVAKKGKMDGDMLYLNGDVVLHAKDGNVYKTDAANYNEQTEILNITSPYVATQNANVMTGDSLSSHIPSKESNASVVHAVFYTIEK